MSAAKQLNIFEQIDIFKELTLLTPNTELNIETKARLKTVTFKNFRTIHGQYEINLKDNINFITPYDMEQDFTMYNDIEDMLKILRGDMEYNDVVDYSLFAEENDKEIMVGVISENNNEESIFVRKKKYRGNDLYGKFKGMSKKGNPLYHKHDLSGYKKELKKSGLHKMALYPYDVPPLGRFIYTHNFNYLLVKIHDLDVEKLVSDTNELLNKYEIGCLIQYDEKQGYSMVELKKIPHKEGYWTPPSYNTTLFDLAMIIAIENQIENSVIVFSNKFGFRNLDGEELDKMMTMLKDNFTKQQVLILYHNPYDHEFGFQRDRFMKNLGYKSDKHTIDPLFNLCFIDETHKFGEGMKNVTIKQAARDLVIRTELSLASKIKLAEKIVLETLYRVKPENVAIAWSGGKDSQVLVDVVYRVYMKLRKYDPKLPLPTLVFCDTGVEFPEHYGFIKKEETRYRELGFTVVRTRPETNFFKIVEEKGFPMFGKAIRRKTHPEIFQKIDELGIKTCGNLCCQKLKEEPAAKLYKELGTDLTFVGILAEESYNRRTRWYDLGDFYYNSTEGLWKSQPLIPFTTEDIWSYNKEFNVPNSPLYDMGYWKMNQDGDEEFIKYSRTGCWPCSMNIQFNGNNMEMLRNTHPKLWDLIMIKKGLSKEIFKFKHGIKNWSETEQKLMEGYLRAKPCHFDTTEWKKAN